MYILFGGDKAKGRFALDDGQPFAYPTQNDIRGGSFNTGSPPEASRSTDQPESMSVSQCSKSEGLSWRSWDRLQIISKNLSIPSTISEKKIKSCTVLRAAAFNGGDGLSVLHFQ